MESLSYSAKKQYHFITKMIAKASDLYMRGNVQKQAGAKHTEKLIMLDKSNEEFKKLLGDFRENLRMFLLIVSALGTIVIDYLLLYNVMTILCEQSHLHWLFKIMVPAMLIVMEITISYFSIVRQWNEEPDTWIDRSLKYFVIVLLIVLSAVVILYDVRGYTPETDGSSFLSFIIDSCVTQILLLIASVIMHLWIVKDAEGIATSIAFFSYRAKRQRVVNKIADMEAAVQDTYGPALVQIVYRLVKAMEDFKRNYPGADVHFEKLIPLDLQLVINAIMGRAVLLQTSK
jgi:hypothetical protein